jgi:16S rRNA C1402 N4-methylase RsmH
LEDENFRPLNEFGEERRSRRIARAIVRSRLECVELIHIPPRPGQ